MNLKNCFFRIKSHLKESGLDKNISDSDIRVMARQIAAAGSNALTASDFQFKVNEMVAKQEARLMAKIKAERTMFISKRVEIVSNIMENRLQWQKDISGGKLDIKGLNDPTKTVIEATRVALQGGSNRPGTGTNMDLQLTREGVYQHILNVHDTAINNVPGLREAASSGALDRDMWQELHAIDNKMPLMKSGNEMALEYAKAIKVTRDAIFSLKKGATPWLEQAEEYLLKQFHDPDRIREVNKVEWLKDAVDTYGEKSFPEMTMEEKESVFSDIHDRILSGDHGTAMDDVDSTRFVNIPGEGGNVARKMGQSRQLIAKDWQSSADYQSKYGPKTVYEGLHRVMNGASKDIAMIEHFGPNPKEMFKSVIATVAKKLDGEERMGFMNQKVQKDLKEAFSVATGSQNVPAAGLRSKSIQGTMTAMYLTKAGLSLPRAALHNLSLAASLLRDANGKNMFQNIDGVASKYIQYMASTTAKTERLNDLGMAFRRLNQEQYRDMVSSSSKPGTFGKISEFLGSLNLHQRSVDSFRAAMASVVSKFMGEDILTPHSELHPQTQKVLARYNIGEDSWNFIRNSVDSLDDKPAITPDGVKEISDPVTETYMRQSGKWNNEGRPNADQLAYARFQEALKVSNLLNEHANLSSAQGGSRQKSWMYGDTTINDGKGALLRAMLEFKQPAMVQSDVFRRGVLSGQGPKGDYAGLAQHYTLSIAATALSTAFITAATGKKQEDYKSVSYAAKILLSSGVAGVLTDPIQNVFTREKPTDKLQSVLEGLLGPAISTAGEAGVHAVSALQGIKHEGSKFGNLISDNTPGVGTLHNLFYTKALYDYYLYNHWKNFMGPGYLGALEKHGQGYNFGRPSSPTFLEK